MPKILVIRFSSIGDIVLTTPVVRGLKRQVKDAQVHYCTKSNFRTILESNPDIDKVHCLDTSLAELVAELKKENFDYIVDLHSNLRTLILKFRLGVPSKSFDKLNFKKWLLVNFKINRLPDVHIVDRYREAASAFGIIDDGKGLDYYIPEKDELDMTVLPSDVRNHYVAFVIGAQHATKRLPAEKIAELCMKIPYPIVLLGGKEDTATGEQVCGMLEGKRKNVFNACGKFNLNQSAYLVQQSMFVFSHDTGLMHIAAALGKEIYSIWGNTVPAFGMYPYKTIFHTLENNAVNCRPCSKIGYNKCPKGHFNCMNQQDFTKLTI